MANYKLDHRGTKINEAITDALRQKVTSFVDLAERDTYFATRMQKLRTGMPILVLVDPVTVEIQVWEGVDSPVTYLSTDWGASTFRAGLNSIGLGGQHLIHSAGENILFQNLSTGIHWSPVWVGLIPYNFTGDEWLSIPPSARVMTTPVGPLELNGPVGAANVNYAASITLQDNESVWGVDVRAGEAFVGEIVYTLSNNGNPEIIKFSQRMQVNVVEGDLIHIHFRHPSESHAGSTINVNILKRDGTTFLVKAGTNETTPWITLHLSIFKDVDVALDHKEFVTSVSGSANWGSHYIVSKDSADLDALAAPVVVASHARQSFRVSDGNSGFLGTTGVVVTLTNLNDVVVTASLRHRNDDMEFTFDGAVWHFFNHRNSKRGVV